ARRLLQRHAHCRNAHVDDTLVLEAAERMDADAGDVDRAHQLASAPRRESNCRRSTIDCFMDSRPHRSTAPSTGSNAYVITCRPSASVFSASKTRRTRVPGRLRSGAVMRAMIRMPSGNSTTPKPKGSLPSYPGGRFCTVVHTSTTPCGLNGTL